MKKYRKDTRVVEAAQYKATPKSLKDIKELLKSTCAKYEESIGDDILGYPRFTILGKTRNHVIYKTNWIVKDGKYCFVVSNDIFKDMFTEIK